MRSIILRGLSLILLFSAVALSTVHFAGRSYYSEGQVIQKLPQEIQSSPQPLGVKITSHTTGQKVPTGELTISGTSTDTSNAKCEVYTDLDDLKPMQKVTARGPGGNSDYSAWTFTYTPAYQLIKNGTNNLTSKISCVDSPTAGNLTKWNSVNVTGIDGMREGGGLIQQQQPSITSAMSNGSTNNAGLIISQSAALSTPETAVPLQSVNSIDNSEETNQVSGEQDNIEDDNSDTETSDSDDDEDDEDDEDDNNVRLANSEDNEDENDNDESDNDAEDDNNDNNNNENNDEEEENGDDCDIGDSGFPFCDGRSEEDESDEDGDDCDIGDSGFPFCDGRRD